MRRAIEQTLDFLTLEPVRIRSFLRLALIGLTALLVSVTHVRHWLDRTFATILVLYALTALVWLAAVLRGPIRPWFGWVSTTADVVFVVMLCIVSGGATVWLLPIFFLLPISVVFLDSPLMTAALGLSVGVGYLLAWFVYAVRDSSMSMPAVAYVQVGCLLWLAAALTGLSYTLKGRATRLRNLLEVRRRLVSEVLQADERNSRRLSENLHDGPLQNLLAARLDLDGLRADPTPEGFDHLDTALRASVAELRAIVASLHPQVLTEVGLTEAVRDLIDGHSRRAGIPVVAHLAEVGRPASEAMLYRAARELLNNAQKYSRASQVRITLSRAEGSVTLTVSDDGIGFDTAILSRRVARGHIGLSSLMVGVEAMEGTVDLRTAPGEGTTVTVTLPECFSDGLPPAAADSGDEATDSPAAGSRIAWR